MLKGENFNLVSVSKEPERKINLWHHMDLTRRINRNEQRSNTDIPLI